LLNITEPAVSQYLKGKRGEVVVFSRDIKKEIIKSAKAISKKNTLLNRETQKLLQKIQENKFICTICNNHAQTDKTCEVCYV
jgi:predicted transcriptional regulator